MSSTYTNTAIGVFFGIFAEFFGSSANIQIKYSHNIEEQKSVSQQIPLFKRNRFRIACVLYVLNGIFNLISCIFASLNVLAPTSSFTIILNAALAHFYFGERLTKLGYFASFMIMCGSTISVLFGHSESKTSFSLTELTDLVMRGGSIFFAMAHWFTITCCILIGKALSKQYELETRIIFDSHGGGATATPRPQYDDDTLSQSTVDNEDLMERIRYFTNKFCKGGNSQYAIRAFCYSFATGSITSWVQFFGKAVGVLISESVGGDEQFNKVGAWLYMLFACWFIYWMMILLSEMMRLFDAILIVPLYETFIIFNMVLLDAIYFGREQNNDETASHKVWFWFGIFVCVVGMFVLTVAQKDSTGHYNEEIIPLMGGGKGLPVDPEDVVHAQHAAMYDHEISEEVQHDQKYLFQDAMDAETQGLLKTHHDHSHSHNHNSYHSTKRQRYDVV